MPMDPGVEQRFDALIDRLAAVIGHATRREPLRAYTQGLVLPGDRKSVEPMAARVDPEHVPSRHQSMHHFVAQATWSDEVVLDLLREEALEAITHHGALEAWILDDTGIPKKGKHSVGVANQYCGVLGKNANCQVAVSLSLANRTASVPAAYRLYLPRAWTDDSERMKAAGVPQGIEFMTKWQIAIMLIDSMLAKGVPRVPVLADAGYGDSVEFRDALTVRGLIYTVGVPSNLRVWPQGKGPLPPPPYSGRGRPPTRIRRDGEHQPIGAKELAQALPPDEWQVVDWREGTKGTMRSRFTMQRVRPAHRDNTRTEPRAEQWLLMEWPEDEPEPTRYWLSTQQPAIAISDLVHEAKLRWRIERDYQELKDELGLDHFEGRGWRGFHHHATLCFAAYTFILAERARLSPPGARALFGFEEPTLPAGATRRGAAAAR